MQAAGAVVSHHAFALCIWLVPGGCRRYLPPCVLQLCCGCRTLYIPPDDRSGWDQLQAQVLYLLSQALAARPDGPHNVQVCCRSCVCVCTSGGGGHIQATVTGWTLGTGSPIMHTHSGQQLTPLFTHLGTPQQC